MPPASRGWYTAPMTALRNTTFGGDRFSLAGKVAVVTGASSGLGVAYAAALARAGAKLVLGARRADRLQETVAAVRAAGGEAIGIPTDVTRIADCDALVAAGMEAFGRIDILVNNAYAGALGPLLELSEKAWRRGFETGPFAAFTFMRACHPHLAASRGSVVNLVTSAMVRWDSSTYGAYASAKQALRTLSRAAAVEWAPDGIRVNSIAPHALTPGLQWWTEQNPEEAAEFVAAIPMRRIGDPELDIGRAVVALVSEDLRYLTGATIPLDGGQAYFG